MVREGAPRGGHRCGAGQIGGLGIQNAFRLRPVKDAVARDLRGVTLDDAVNAVRSKQPRAISTPESAVAALVIPTNEELAMAQETLAIIS